MRRSPSFDLWLIWKTLVLLSIIFLVITLFRIQFHNNNDELVNRRSQLPIWNHDDDLYIGNPRIAFMFLVRRDLPLDFLWQSFFENADAANYSIYIHSEPGFVFDETNTRSSYFYNQQLSDSIKVGWGESSMIEAEKLLIQTALENTANRRFLLLSDSCVPLYNFSYSYNYLMGSSKSFVDSFLDRKEGRYNPKMSSIIPMRKWRKGSQWIALVRSHAKVVAYDDVVFPVFKNLCKRRPPLDASKGKQNLKLQKQHNCIPDEHYVQTLLAMNDLEGELERRTVTYTSWVQSATNMETKSWHPVTYNYASSNPEQIKRIKDINHVYYETEHRTEWCRNNAVSVPCFLFARKFSRDGAMRLLSQGISGQAFALTMEVGNQETIVEIKRKIQHVVGVPICCQILSICDWELLDGLDLDDYPIVSEGTKVDLTINPNPIPFATQIQVTVKFASRKHNIQVDTTTETVGSLKEKIHIIDGTPIKQMTLCFSGVEMEEDFRSLSEYGVGEFAEIIVFVKTTSRVVASRRLGFVVQTSSALLNSTCIPLEMKDSSTINELRELLLGSKIIPMDDYIFIHKQRIMRENCSLRWHGVVNHDYLYIFKGTVSNLD